MKRSAQNRRVVQEPVQSGPGPGPGPGPGLGPGPDKVGWVRKFCGRGLFREIWRNRFLFLRGDHLYICHREVKDERGAQDSVDLLKYDRCEDLKKHKSRSKKSHSRFTLLHSPNHNTGHNLVFLAVSPEEKESWISALNTAIARAKTRTKDRTLDQVLVEEDGALVHPTKDRVRIPLGRRLPSRGHLVAVASSSHGSLTLDLVCEEDYSGRGSWERGLGPVGMGPGGVDCRVVGGRQRAGTDVSKLRPSSRESRVKTGSLPRASERNWGRGESSKALKNRHIQVFKGQSRTPQPGKKMSSQGRNRCASMDEVLSSRPALIRSELRSALKRCPTEEQPPVGQLQSLIAQRMQRAQELLEEMRLQELQKTKAQRERASHKDSPKTGQNQSKTRSAGSGSPRVKAKDSPQTRAKKNKTKSNQSPKLRDQVESKSRTKTTESPLLRDHSETRSRNLSQSPKTKTCSESPKPDSGNSPENTVQSPSRTGPDQDQEEPKEPDKNQGPEETSESVERDKEESRESEGTKPDGDPVEDSDQDQDSDQDLSVSEQRVEAERLLQEALCSWKQAQEVLQEVKELQSQTLRRQRRKTYLNKSQDQDLNKTQDLNKSQDQDLNKTQDQDLNKTQDLTKSQDQGQTKTSQTESRQTQTGSPAGAEPGSHEGAEPEESTPEGEESQKSSPDEDAGK